MATEGWLAVANINRNGAYGFPLGLTLLLSMVLVVVAYAIYCRAIPTQSLRSFTLKDMFWVTALLAVCVAWRLERAQIIDRYDFYIQQHLNFKWTGGPMYPVLQQRRAEPRP